MNILFLALATLQSPGLGGQKVMAFLAVKEAPLTQAFYEEKLGLRLESSEHGTLVFIGNGTMIRIQVIGDAFKPVNYTMLGWQVANVPRTVEGLIKRGVKFEHYQGFNQDKLGIWTAPDGTQVAWFKDPDGNVLSLSELPKTQ